MRGGGDKLHDKAEHLGASENARSAPPALTSGPTRVQAIVERGHHAEVPPTAAQPPQQVGVPSALAATRSPSAVTTFAETRLSQPGPCLRAIRDYRNALVSSVGSS
jgi:hypothetical protein